MSHKRFESLPDVINNNPQLGIEIYNAVASAGAASGAAFGQGYQYDSETSPVSTTSGTESELLRVVLPNAPAGKYRVSCSGTWQSTNSSTNCYIALREDPDGASGLIINADWDSASNAASDRVPIAIWWIHDHPGGTLTIALNWKRSDGGGTLTMYNRTLEAWRVL